MGSVSSIIHQIHTCATRPLNYFCRAKCTETDLLKIQDLSHMGPIWLTQFGTNPDNPTLFTSWYLPVSPGYWGALLIVPEKVIRVVCICVAQSNPVVRGTSGNINILEIK